MLNPIKKIAECINKFRSEKERKQKYQSLMTDLHEAFDQLKSLIKDSPERIEFSVFNGWLDAFSETFNQAQNISKPEGDQARHILYLEVVDYLTKFLEDYFKIKKGIYKENSDKNLKSTYKYNCERYELAVSEAVKCMGETFMNQMCLFVNTNNLKSVMNSVDTCSVKESIERNYTADINDIHIEEGTPIPQMHYRFNGNMHHICGTWVRCKLLFLWAHQKKSPN